MSFQDITFDVTEEVLALGVKCVCFAVGGLTNRESDAEFEKIRAQSLEKILAERTLAQVLEDPILQGFRQLHNAIGFSNRNFVAAPENLYQNLFKYRRLPHVNLLVDIYNLVSVETGLSLGAHDIALVSGNIRLRLTDGSEGFWPLGSPEAKTVRNGAYAYTDEANDVICMLEVRQVEKTKTTLDTTNCFYIVQGNAASDAAYVRAGAERLISLITRFMGGQVRMLYP